MSYITSIKCQQIHYFIRSKNAVLTAFKYPLNVCSDIIRKRMRVVSVVLYSDVSGCGGIVIARPGRPTYATSV